MPYGTRALLSDAKRLTSIVNRRQGRRKCVTSQLCLARSFTLDEALQILRSDTCRIRMLGEYSDQDTIQATEIRRHTVCERASMDQEFADTFVNIADDLSHVRGRDYLRGIAEALNLAHGAIEIAATAQIPLSHLMNRSGDSAQFPVPRMLHAASVSQMVLNTNLSGQDHEEHSGKHCRA
jgi:hypothetical protein